MSFILDALKRSERERQETAAPNDSSPAGGERPGRRRLWMWIAGAALTVNALGVAAFFMLPSGEQASVEIYLPPAEPEGGALPPPAVPGPDGHPPAQAAPTPPPPSAKAGTESEWAKLTAGPAGPQTAPPPGPPSPPVPMKNPAPAPESAQPAPAPEPAQPPAPTAEAAPGPQPEAARNTAAAKPIAEPEPTPPAAEVTQGPEEPKVTALAAEAEKPASPAPPRASADSSPAGATTAALDGGASAYTRRGQAFEREGLYDRAIEEYTRAILIDPAFAEAYLGRGWAHLAKGNHDQAIRNYGEAIGLDPSLAEALFARGWAYEQLGQRDRAIEEYGDAIRIAPDHGDARLSRGILRFYSGQPEPAAGDFSAIVEGGGGLRAYALLWLYLSRTRAGGEADRELLDLAGQLDLEPWPGVIVKLYLGRVPAARVIAETLDSDPIKQRENECVAYFFLGQERLVKGDGEKAAEYFQKTLDTGITGYRQYAAAEEELRRLGRLN